MKLSPIHFNELLIFPCENRQDIILYEDVSRVFWPTIYKKFEPADTLIFPPCVTYEVGSRSAEDK